MQARLVPVRGQTDKDGFKNSKGLVTYMAPQPIKSYGLVTCMAPQPIKSYGLVTCNGPHNKNIGPARPAPDLPGYYPMLPSAPGSRAVPVPDSRQPQLAQEEQIRVARILLWGV